MQENDPTSESKSDTLPGRLAGCLDGIKNRYPSAFYSMILLAVQVVVATVLFIGLFLTFALILPLFKSAVLTAWQLTGFVSLACAGSAAAWILGTWVGCAVIPLLLWQRLEAPVPASVVMRDFGLIDVHALLNFARLHRLRVYRTFSPVTVEPAGRIICRLDPLFTSFMYFPTWRSDFLATGRILFEREQVAPLINASLNALPEKRAENTSAEACVEKDRLIAQLEMELQIARKKLSETGLTRGPQAKAEKRKAYFLIQGYAAMRLALAISEKWRGGAAGKVNIRDVETAYNKLLLADPELADVLTLWQEKQQLPDELIALVRLALTEANVNVDWGGQKPPSVRQVADRINK